MANDFATLVPKIFGMTLPSLRNACRAVKAVRVDFDAETAKVGKVIDMPVPVASSTTDVVPGVSPPANTDKAPTTKQITLDQWKRSEKVALTAKEVREIEAGSFKNSTIAEQSIALVEGINGALLLGMKNASFRSSGSAGTNPYASTDADTIDVRRILGTQKAPSNDRHLLLGPNAEARALAIASIKDASLRGTAATKQGGEIGELFGINHWMDQQVVAHTAGTATGTLTLGTTIPAIGASTINLKASTTGTLKKGDLLTVTTSSVVYYYVVTADVATVDTTAAGIAVSVFPTIQTTHVAGDTWTKVASHSANIGLQRGAYGLAIRPLNPQDLGLGQHIPMTDPETGISLMYSLIPEYMQDSVQVSILYGHAALRPEWMVRLLGDPASP
jgi:hypothetical protein